MDIHHTFTDDLDLDFDEEEARYWRHLRGMFAPFVKPSSTIHTRQRKSEVVGFSQGQLSEFLKDLHPELRHKPEEILEYLEKKKILEPVDYYSDVVLPETAVDIFTTEIPEVADDLLSVEKVSKWLSDDIKKIVLELSDNIDKKEKRSDIIDMARFIADTYRRGIISLRRKVKTEREERELQKEVEYYRSFGISDSISDLFNDNPAIVNSLGQADIRYLFQLISKSRTEIKNLEGIGQIRLEKIEEVLNSRGLTFTEKEKTENKRRRKPDPLESQIVNKV
jgi:hypothetical protein